MRDREPVKHDEVHRSGISGHFCQPQCREFMRKRQIGCACFPYPQYRCRDICRVGGEYSNGVSPFDPFFYELMGKAICPDFDLF